MRNKLKIYLLILQMGDHKLCVGVHKLQLGVLKFEVGAHKLQEFSQIQFFFIEGVTQLYEFS